MLTRIGALRVQGRKTTQMPETRLCEVCHMIPRLMYSEWQVATDAGYTPLASVKLDSEPARIPQRLGAAPLVNDCAETHNNRRLHAWRSQEVRARQVRQIVRDLQKSKQCRSQDGAPT